MGILPMAFPRARRPRHLCHSRESGNLSSSAYAMLKKARSGAGIILSQSEESCSEDYG